MTKSVSKREKRTYFNNPLVEESLLHLPAALEHKTSREFRAYLVDNLHFNSMNSRIKASEYIAGRFSLDGAMNLDLAKALRKFGNGGTGRGILYFEILLAVPVLQDIAIRWLAELPPEGGTRPGLLAFLGPLLGGRSEQKVAQSALQVFKLCGKMRSPKLGHYLALWAEPPLEVFLYVLARLHPGRTMVRVDAFSNEPIIRGMLWPPASIPALLKAAQEAGHVSKISQLDQYHQFALSATGADRMRMLLSSGAPERESGLAAPVGDSSALSSQAVEPPAAPAGKPIPPKPAKGGKRGRPRDAGQLTLWDDSDQANGKAK